MSLAIESKPDLSVSMLTCYAKICARYSLTQRIIPYMKIFVKRLFQIFSQFFCYFIQAGLSLRQLDYLTTFKLLCQTFFTTFLKFFEKSFSWIFDNLFVHRSATACISYHTIQVKSTVFSHFFTFFLKNFIPTICCVLRAFMIQFFKRSSLCLKN